MSFTVAYSEESQVWACYVSQEESTVVRADLSLLFSTNAVARHVSVTQIICMIYYGFNGIQLAFDAQYKTFMTTHSFTYFVVLASKINGLGFDPESNGFEPIPAWFTNPNDILGQTNAVRIAKYKERRVINIALTCWDRRRHTTSLATDDPVIADTAACACHALLLLLLTRQPRLLGGAVSIHCPQSLQRHGLDARGWL